MEPATSSNNSDVRCLKHRLEVPWQQKTTEMRSMVIITTDMAYQCQRGIFIKYNPETRNKHIMFRLDNKVAVRCLNKARSSRSYKLQKLSEKNIFSGTQMQLDPVCKIFTGSTELADRCSIQAQDPLNRVGTVGNNFQNPDMSNEATSDRLVCCTKQQKVDMFLTWTEKTSAGVPDAFTISWNQ